MLTATDTAFASGYTGMRVLAQTGITATVTSFQSDVPGGGSTTVTRYGFTGAGDSPDLTLNSSNVVIEKTIGLLGGVMVTRRGSASTDVWSNPNIHGDIAATADGNGTKTGSTYLYDPFGNALNGEPDNSNGTFKYGWEGKSERGTDTAGGLPLIEMGARVYAPSLGRFLGTDPIMGGNANDYVYPQDPVNQADLSGLQGPGKDTVNNCSLAHARNLRIKCRSGGWHITQPIGRFFMRYANPGAIFSMGGWKNTANDFRNGYQSTRNYALNHGYVPGETHDYNQTFSPGPYLGFVLRYLRALIDLARFG
jgi:RHS repeat-associated protein